MREPSQRNPGVRLKPGERPADSIGRKPAGDVAVVNQSGIVIDVDEVVGSRLTEHQANRQQQQAADGQHFAAKGATGLAIEGRGYFSGPQTAGSRLAAAGHSILTRQPAAARRSVAIWSAHGEKKSGFAFHCVTDGHRLARDCRRHAGQAVVGECGGGVGHPGEPT